MKTIFLSHGFNASFGSIDALVQVLEPNGYRLTGSAAFNVREGRASYLIGEIRNCQAVVAFLDGQSSNVLFECGLALGAGKPLILVSTSMESVWPELASFRVVVGSDPLSVAREVSYSLERTIETDAFTPRIGNSALEFLRHADPGLLDSMRSSDFEQFIAQVLREVGCTVEEVPSSADIGFDFMSVTPSGRRIPTEVKKTTRNSKLSVGAIQRLVGSAVNAGASEALLVTTAQLTSAARDYARMNPFRVHLIGFDELSRLSSDGIEAIL